MWLIQIQILVKYQKIYASITFFNSKNLTDEQPLPQSLTDLCSLLHITEFHFEEEVVNMLQELFHLARIKRRNQLQFCITENTKEISDSLLFFSHRLLYLSYIHVFCRLFKGNTSTFNNLDPVMLQVPRYRGHTTNQSICLWVNISIQRHLDLESVLILVTPHKNMMIHIETYILRLDIKNDQ